MILWNQANENTSFFVVGHELCFVTELVFRHILVNTFHVLFDASGGFGGHSHTFLQKSNGELGVGFSG